MKRASAQPTAETSQRLICGIYSKQEAAQLIGRGARHLHSSTQGEADACARITTGNLAGQTAPYPWEKTTESSSIYLLSSAQRHDMINGLLSGPTKRDLREKVHMVLEELLTNAIYHGYRNADGTRRFPRRTQAALAESEKITVSFARNERGIYLCVADQAGSLGFEEISRAVARGYSKGENQIETKESGAGLGTYMVFETVSHLKIVTDTGRCTTISCWIAENPYFDPDSFSFNFYEGR